MGSLPRSKAGVGSAVNDTTRQMGGALGVAVIGSLLSSVYTAHLTDAAAGRVPQPALDAATELGGRCTRRRTEDRPRGRAARDGRSAGVRRRDGHRVARHRGGRRDRCTRGAEVAAGSGRRRRRDVRDVRRPSVAGRRRRIRRSTRSSFSPPAAAERYIGIDDAVGMHCGGEVGMGGPVPRPLLPPRLAVGLDRSIEEWEGYAGSLSASPSMEPVVPSLSVHETGPYQLMALRSRGMWRRSQNTSTRRRLGRARLSCHTLVSVPIAPN